MIRQVRNLNFLGLTSFVTFNIMRESISTQKGRSFSLLQNLCHKDHLWFNGQVVVIGEFFQVCVVFSCRCFLFLTAEPYLTKRRIYLRTVLVIVIQICFSSSVISWYMNMRLSVCVYIVFFCVRPSWKIHVSKEWPLERVMFWIKWSQRVKWPSSFLASEIMYVLSFENYG